MPGAGDTAMERTDTMSRQRRGSVEGSLEDTAAPVLSTTTVTSDQVMRACLSVLIAG